MNRAAARGVDWWVARLATSGDFQTDPHRVRYDWSFREQVEAHLTLDALEEIRDLHRPDPPEKKR